MPAKQTGTAKRADAQRSIVAIVDAATECLSRDPAASTSEIAKAAGVGRVTLYGHFPSRSDLVDAVFVYAIEQGEAEPWLVGVMHNVMHGAADEINSGRLTADYITATLLAAFTSPGERVPA